MISSTSVARDKGSSSLSHNISIGTVKVWRGRRKNAKFNSHFYFAFRHQNLSLQLQLLHQRSRMVVSSVYFPLPLPKHSPPAHRPVLKSFATPGFQSNTTKSKARNDMVCASSDSTPPTAGLKRDSSDLSFFGESSPNASKRQKKVPVEEKENVLKISNKYNIAIREHSIQRSIGREVCETKKSFNLLSDLASVGTTFLHLFTLVFIDSFHYKLSLEALQNLKLFALSERVRIGDECLAYHKGKDITKDIVLLEAQRLSFD